MHYITLIEYSYIAMYCNKLSCQDRGYHFNVSNIGVLGHWSPPSRFFLNIRDSTPVYSDM